jgi:hypothetical protein
MYGGAIVGRIAQISFAGNEQRWAWSFKRDSANGYEMGQTATRDEAMAAFRSAWDARAQMGES